MSTSNGRNLGRVRSSVRSYSALAAECERQAQLAVEEPHFREMQQRLARTYAALAEAEEASAKGGQPAGRSPREAA